MKICRIFSEWLILLMLLGTGRVAAQSTIFNIPTTDTVSAKHVYLEFDFLVQAPGPGHSRIHLYNPRLVVGAPRNLEFGVNFPLNRVWSDVDSTTGGYVQPNVKWKFYNNDTAGIALAAGGLMNTPLNDRNAQDSWGLIYALVSKKIRTGNGGPRLHAGVYKIVSANQDFDRAPVSFLGPRGGAILGYEQPICAKINIVMDWYSGSNSIGYFTPGVSITIPGGGLINAGYSIGNDSWADSNAVRNRYFFVYYGVTF